KAQSRQRQEQGARAPGLLPERLQEPPAPLEDQPSLQVPYGPLPCPS
ncbi:hypothetical protein BN1723_016510, partial [Verticillium longisporum]